MDKTFNVDASNDKPNGTLITLSDYYKLVEDYITIKNVAQSCANSLLPKSKSEDEELTDISQICIINENQTTPLSSPSTALKRYIDSEDEAPIKRSKK